MKNALVIFLFTLGITLFYNWVGQMVPQKEVHPPPDATIRADMSTEEMIEAGKIIVEGKGTCTNCHNGSRRFPLLESVGAVAGSRKEGVKSEDYLAETLYEPNKFIVEPFAPGMPAVNKPPIGLSDEEILTVIAYLQSMGGEVTVTMESKFAYQGKSAAAAPAAAAEVEEGGEQLDAKGLMGKYGCLACHALDAPVRLVGPSLYDIGARMPKLEIYEAILEPDAKIATGFPPGVMPGTLNGNGFYDKVSSGQLKTIVEYLFELKGGK